MTDYMEELKYAISLLGFIFIVYPLRTYVIPFWLWVLENASTFWSMALIWVILYLYDYNLTELAQTFANKVVDQDIWIFTWMLTPLVSFWGYGIQPVSVILFIMAMIAFTKVYQLFRVAFTQFKKMFGDVLIVVLWVYYRLTGQRENAVMLITGDEAKNKLVMYVLILIVLLLSVAFLALPNLMMSTVTHTPMTNMSLTVYNETYNPGILSYVI